MNAMKSRRRRGTIFVSNLNSTTWLQAKESIGTGYAVLNPRNWKFSIND
jgi:hypothetical protein